MPNVTAIHSRTVNQKKIGTHIHHLWELIYYAEGNGSIAIGPEKRTFGPHDFVIIPPDIPHRDWSEGQFRVIYVAFQNFPLSPKQEFPLFHDNDDCLIECVLEQLLRVYLRQDQQWSSLADALQGVVFQYLRGYLPSPIQETAVKQLESRIVANLSNPDFTVNEALEGLFLNGAYLRTLFTKSAGRTPLQYLTHRRIELAKQLLSSSGATNYSIQYIARLCGFSDPYYFSRVFKKHTGVSPKSWLTQYRDKTPSGV